MEEIIVDRAEVIEIRGKWYVKGYLDGTEVVTVGGWDTMDEHANVTLYDADGNAVEHKIVETLDPVVFIQSFVDTLKEHQQNLE